MKKETEFRNFLLYTYSNEKTNLKLSPKVVFDIISRCKAIERIMECSLPTTPKKIDELVGEMKIKAKKFGNSRYPYSPYVYALKKYQSFLFFLKNQSQCIDKF